MSSRITTFIAGSLLMALFTTVNAFAQGPRGGGPGALGRGAGPAGRVGGLPLAGLNLTQAQQDFIRDIRQRNRESARAIEERLREAQEAQHRAMEAMPPDEGAIRAAILALANVQADLAIHQARMQTEIWFTLTPDQQTQVMTRQAERDQRPRSVRRR